MAVVCVYNYPGEPRQYLFGYSGSVCGDSGVASAGYTLAYSYNPQIGNPPLLSEHDINQLASAVLALWAAVWVTRFVRGLIPRGIT